MTSLLDLANKQPIDCWLVFRDRDADASAFEWLFRRLKPGFGHVELWKYDRGLWLRVDPCIEFTALHVLEQPPWEDEQAAGATVMRYRAVVPYDRMVMPFHVGPMTCVELAKAILGVRAPFWIRTPWQLYKFLQRAR